MIPSESVDALRHRMVADVAQTLWHVYHDDPAAPYLIWPTKRDASTRVSEQESKILITQWLQLNQCFYSVETPTNERYRQSGKSDMSARIDITVYSERKPSARVLNIELKAATATDKAFTKDFEKLLRERVRGLWFHTLTKASHRTWLTLERRICRSIDAVSKHSGIATHVVDLAFCVLKSRTLVEFSIDFSSNWRSGLEASIRQATGAVPQPSGVDARPARPLRVASGARSSPKRGAEATRLTLKQLVFVPSLEPRTILHLSTRGESYKLRYFDGSHRRAPWKAANCDTLTSLRALHPATLVVDVAADGRDLSQHAYWQERVSDLNAANGLPGYDAMK